MISKWILLVLLSTTVSSEGKKPRFNTLLWRVQLGEQLVEQQNDPPESPSSEPIEPFEKGRFDDDQVEKIISKSNARAPRLVT